MNDLQLIKAFAEIDGVNVCIIGNIECVRNLSRLQDGSPYNPVTDLALNCAARDKYRVEVDYKARKVFINKNITAYSEVNYDEGCSARLCRAVIECIVKSKGK